MSQAMNTGADNPYEAPSSPYKSVPPILQQTHNYELTRYDLFLGSFAALRHNRLVLGFSLVLAFLVAMESYSLLRESPLIIRLIGAVVSTLAMIVIFIGAQLLVAALTAYARSHKGVLGRHTIVLTDEGLIERTDYNDTLHRWIGFHRLRQTSGYLYVYMTETLFHQIPTRSFSSADQVRDFADEIRRRAKSATRP